MMDWELIFVRLWGTALQTKLVPVFSVTSKQEYLACHLLVIRGTVTTGVHFTDGATGARWIKTATNRRVPKRVFGLQGCNCWGLAHSKLCF